MGAGASTNEVNEIEDEKLIQQFAQFYKANPERAEKIISGGKKIAADDSTKENKDEDVESGTQSGKLEEEVLSIMNEVRAAPLSLIPKLEERLTRYEGNVLKREGKPNLLTDEGAAAVEDCIAYLKQVAAAGPMAMKDGLTKGAQDHVKDIGENGSTSHTGNDGSSMQDRIERYGDWTDLIGENICFAEDEALEIVLALLIDDAVKSRGHRKNIFNERFKSVGIAFGPHKNFRHVCVMNFSGEYGPKVEKLAEAVTVTVDRERKEEEVANLHKVLASIPFPEIKEQVLKALDNPDITVVLNYKPGSIESRITEGGVTNVLSGTWSTAMQSL